VEIIWFRADAFQVSRMASGKAVSWCQNCAEGFRHFSRSNVSWSQELIELGKFCNGLGSLKGSEIVL